MSIISINPNQFFKLNFESAIQHFKDGLITAKGLVFYAVGILRKIGDHIRIYDVEQFVSLLGISKSSFYGSLKKLKQENKLSFQAVEGMEIWIAGNKEEKKKIPKAPKPTKPPIPAPVLNQSQQYSEIVESGSKNLENQSKILESQSSIVENNSKIVENKSRISDSESKILEPESKIVENESRNKDVSKRCSPLSDILSDIKQISLRSISDIPDDERERFILFCKKKAASLPTPPAFFDKWMEKSFDWLYSIYSENRSPVIDPKKNNLPAARNEAIKKATENIPSNLYLIEDNPFLEEDVVDGFILRIDAPLYGSSAVTSFKREPSVRLSDGQWVSIGQWKEMREEYISERF